VERRINEAEAAVIREIFERAARGSGTRRIAHDLNARGVAAPRPGGLDDLEHVHPSFSWTDARPSIHASGAHEASPRCPSQALPGGSRKLMRSAY
jgi:hypothetical protein